MTVYHFPSYWSVVPLMLIVLTYLLYIGVCTLIRCVDGCVQISGLIFQLFSGVLKEVDLFVSFWATLKFVSFTIESILFFSKISHIEMIYMLGMGRNEANYKIYFYSQHYSICTNNLG